MTRPGVVVRGRAMEIKQKKKRGERERERVRMNNGSDDAKEQNNAGALGIYRGVTLTRRTAR